ncbi:MAG TPA: TAXI family TRAP transporter solute-binding subunit [Candidatus Acidoferrales bacterium]|nr:TAXI family TRAP transporter solute-binding subunit [Candidatus Acidoferrales bacterium]
MEKLPRGANFQRAKMLWEIGLHIAGDPATPYYGNRDMCVAVGSGSGETFRPWLRMATGAPHLAYAVCRGELEMAMVNPSGFLTQAYRGTGLFSEPLPVRVLANYPSWDRFVYVVHPRTGLSSLAEIKEKRYPLRLSLREDPAHSTRVLVDQTLAAYGFTLAELQSWGGSLQLNGGPGDQRRLDALAAGTIDAIFDEGLPLWFEQALAAEMRPVPLEESIFAKLEAIGWRRAVIPANRFRGLKADYPCLDYSGWPLYTRASLPDEDAYKVCDAIAARADEIYWEDSFTGIGQLARDTEATPRDVPLHPGAAKWYRERGFDV